MHAYDFVFKSIVHIEAIIVYARCERRLRDKLALRVCVRAYVSLNLKKEERNEKCHNSDIRSSFLWIDCIEFIQTGRNQKLIFILCNKSVSRFLITALVY